MSVLLANDAHRAEFAMNETFSIMHETAGEKCSIHVVEFILHLASTAYLLIVNKTRT